MICVQGNRDNLFVAPQHDSGSMLLLPFCPHECSVLCLLRIDFVLVSAEGLLSEWVMRLTYNESTHADALDYGSVDITVFEFSLRVIAIRLDLVRAYSPRLTHFHRQRWVAGLPTSPAVFTMTGTLK